MSFARGFLIGERIKQARERQVQEEERQKLELKRLNEIFKGQVAEREQREQAFAQQLLRNRSLGQAFQSRYLPEASFMAEPGEFGPGTEAAGLVGNLSQYVGAGGDVKAATGLLPPGLNPPDLLGVEPERVVFKSLIAQGYSPAEALQQATAGKKAENEVGLALKAAGGDPEKALAFMRQQRLASRAQTTINLAQKEEQRKEQERVTAGIVTTDINRVLFLMENATLPTTGAAGAFLSKIPGTASANMKYLLDTIRANIGFQKLQQMRQSSPTGGALGNVTERENALLQATLGSLEQAQTQDQFVYNLKRIHDQFLDTVHGAGNGPPRLLKEGQGQGRDLSKVPLEKWTTEELLRELGRQGP